LSIDQEYPMQNTTIERFEKNARLSRIVVHQGTAYLSGLTADDKSENTLGQTRQILRKADALLKSIGTDKSRVLSAQIWLRDIVDFDAMNEAWMEWVDQSAPPARATVEAKLALPNILVEIQFVAAA
jgi:enamine deaminase RidA (YjgF/YER057c/UK114 family)